jgi:exodeoxyribonuclease VII large subunit
MASSPLTVSKLTAHLVRLFEQDDALRDVQVVGEVSNWKRAASGHVYFRLKDAGATINAVMWKGSTLAHSWLPRDGDQVIAHGYVSIYPEGGAYQLYANRLLPAGKGQLYAQFEALKERLRAAGLFDAERKRPIPAHAGALGNRHQPRRGCAARYPARAGRALATGGGAHLPDVGAGRRRAAAHRCGNRGGEPLSADTVAPIDTLIVARGGGSIEDLWAFNDERVANAVAASAIPTIAGVGHETDFTIVDFVADLRAPTPSAAAAAAVPARR